VPFSQFVLKVHSRCDLACDHCYVYEHADQSWRNRPTAMSDETATRAAARIAEHAETYGLTRVQVVLHGGEPLLAGHARLRRIAGALRAAVGGICELNLRIHTNGVLLDDRFCDLFIACGIKVGISLDGDRAANDRHRRYADGRSSYDQVIRAVNRLRGERYRHLYAGLLCTVDVANDPIVVYESLLALDPPMIDFLLPHATWDQPPFRPPGRATAYADWLIAVFDQWINGGRPVPVRLFDSIIRAVYGHESLTEALGLGPSDLIVIETDGSFEQADSLKIAFDGAPATGLNVVDHSLDEVAGHPGVTARQQGLAGLCDTCQTCPVVDTCGGGLYAHRYRTGTAFSNPSVYCADLMKLIKYVQRRVSQTTAVGGAARDRPTHVVPAADLADLAAGFGGSSAVRYLAESQRSVRRALVAAVHDAVAARPGSRTAGTGTAAHLRAAWDVLTQVDRDNPQALDTVLGHPYVRTWAVHCLERFGDDEMPGRSPGGTWGGTWPEGNGSSVPLATDLGHLAAIAAAAAVHAGVDARLAVPVRDGAAHLPTLGRFDIGQVDTATVEVTGGTLTGGTDGGRWVVAPATVAAGRPDPDSTSGDARWRPVRRLSADGITVTVEDTDPYRDCHQWRAAPRLTYEAAAGWQHLFEGAWDLIRRDHAAYAPGLAAGLTTVMPLTAAVSGRDISATARNAFGAVGIALPADAATLALLLIHEFQHVKLGAVLDLFDLFDETDPRLFVVPWRQDPRPLEGALQGTYAHVAVTDFWRVRRHTAAGPAADAAAIHFARCRAQTIEAIETLAASGSLTTLGLRFLTGMRATVTPWLDEPVPSTTRSATRARDATDHRFRSPYPAALAGPVDSDT
jgi:uncharacterized protein